MMVGDQQLAINRCGSVNLDDKHTNRRDAWSTMNFIISVLIFVDKQKYSGASRTRRKKLQQYFI